MFLHMSALVKHPFTCIHFRKTILHLFDPAKYHPTQLTFQRPLEFPLHFIFLTERKLCNKVDNLFKRTSLQNIFYFYKTYPKY
ncbi:rCG24467, partial [Rattus norvegicus]